MKFSTQNKLIITPKYLLDPRLREDDKLGNRRLKVRNRELENREDEDVKLGQ
ncbi:MAG: hypothetical protein ACJA02_001093 [Myxococcota bacterium]|jgi:hypothetical protein